MSCLVKMTDCSFDEYILSLSLSVFLGLVLFGRATVSATCRETTHTLPPINVCNTHIVHGEVREKESVVDAPESCKKIYIYCNIFCTNIHSSPTVCPTQLRVSCNCAACFFKREIQVVPIHVYICAACFFKREIQVALFTFTHLHRHLISSPSPIISLPSPIHHLFICMFTFTFRYPTIVLDRLVYVFNHM